MSKIIEESAFALYHRELATVGETLYFSSRAIATVLGDLKLSPTIEKLILVHGTEVNPDDVCVLPARKGSNKPRLAISERGMCLLLAQLPCVEARFISLWIIAAADMQLHCLADDPSALKEFLDDSEKSRLQRRSMIDALDLGDAAPFISNDGSLS